MAETPAPMRDAHSSATAGSHITDLAPGRSHVEHLVESGQQVFTL